MAILAKIIPTISLVNPNRDFIWIRKFYKNSENPARILDAGPDIIDRIIGRAKMTRKRSLLPSYESCPANFRKHVEKSNLLRARGRRRNQSRLYASVGAAEMKLKQRRWYILLYRSLVKRRALVALVAERYPQRTIHFNALSLLGSTYRYYPHLAVMPGGYIEGPTS